MFPLQFFDLNYIFTEHQTNADIIIHFRSILARTSFLDRIKPAISRFFPSLTLLLEAVDAQRSNRRGCTTFKVIVSQLLQETCI